jgi:proline iminopeptidase
MVIAEALHQEDRATCRVLLALLFSLGLSACVPGADAREGFVDAPDAVSLYFTSIGAGSDTVIVVHGAGAGLSYLAPDLERLARDRVLIFYDQRGFGRSALVDDPALLTIDHHVADLDAIREYFSLQRVSLLGHSWGGVVAAAFAASHPERVNRLLLLDPAVPAFDPYGYSVIQRIGALSERFGPEYVATADSIWMSIPTAADPVDACEQYLSIARPLYYFLTEEAAARSRGEFCAGSESAVRNAVLVSGLILGTLYGEGWDLRPRLAAVTAPVLVVSGLESLLRGEPAEAWVRELRNARLLEAAEAGHYIQVDRPDMFFAAAEELFRGEWPPASRSIP